MIHAGLRMQCLTCEKRRNSRQLLQYEGYEKEGMIYEHNTQTGTPAAADAAG